jgi:predicted transcriptional regulator
MISKKYKDIYDIILLHDLGIRFHAIETIIGYDRKQLKPRLNRLIRIGLIRKDTSHRFNGFINDMYYALSPTEIVSHKTI